MAFRRGNFKTIDLNIKESEKRHKQGWVRQLRLQKGQSAVVYFSGKLDGEHPEPFLAGRHYAKASNFFYWCAGETSCPACIERTRGNKTFQKPQQMGVLNVVDLTKLHKLEGQGKDGKDDYQVCTEDARCRHCRNKLPTIDAGRKVIELAQTHINLIGEVDAQLAQNCASCKRGHIKVAEYECPMEDCGEPLDWAPEDDEGLTRITCEGCKRKIIPAEVLECTECKKPVRATLMNYGCPVRITKTGEGKSTQYLPSPIWPPPQPPAWVFEENQQPFDLLAHTEAESPDALSIKLGIHMLRSQDDQNPFETPVRRAAPEEDAIPF